MEQLNNHSDRFQAFSFGDPESVLDKSDIVNYLQSWSNGKWYEPPISPEGLSKSFRSSSHHSSAIYTKRNVIRSTYRPNSILSLADFDAMVLDYLVFGNAYLELRRNKLGEPFKLKRALAKYTRRSIVENEYYYIAKFDEDYKFKTNSVCHLMQSDIDQEIYGVPEYLSALSSAWLNESATLFRRRYYKNGSHAGYIMYLTDAAQDTRDIDALREAIKSSKGPGNFTNLFMYAPNGKKEGLQVIPLSEVAAKDEFFNIKNVTRDDVLAAHRVPPQLMGIVPNVTGGFGNISDAAKIFNTNEIKPLQAKLKDINEWLGEEVVSFNNYDLDVAPVGPQIV